MEMYKAVGIVIPEILVLHNQSAMNAACDNGEKLTLRRQSHRWEVFSTPLNLRVFDCALSRLVCDFMADMLKVFPIFRNV
jgi:hypothetical protein